MKRREALLTLAGGSLAALAAFLPAPAVAAPIRWQSFAAGSESALRQQQRGRPFVLAFWSVHCPPCRDELALWAGWQRRFPQLRMLLVNTDFDEDLPAAEQLLAKAGAGRLEHWLLADEMVERVRWTVDPAWHGELPMTRFYDAAHQAQTRLGKLDVAATEKLLLQLAGVRQ